MKRNRVLIGAVLAGAAVSGLPAWGAPPLPIPPSVLRDVERSARGEGPASVAGKNEQEKIALLKEKALGNDARASLAAIKELKGMGAVARPTTARPASSPARSAAPPSSSTSRRPTPRSRSPRP